MFALKSYKENVSEMLCALISFKKRILNCQVFLKRNLKHSFIIYRKNQI